ncbi:GBS Bsp-like repeat-containing protein [Acetobacterium wieringae]|uniref:GBS Bsp-like repeat-containing protein n=1 Tax=Acetobacterium wieringae TaxID=52694 RepID=UPI002B208158|nr:GBS Bsp-like repeat-containing protein [Acetobacterium wieringae]MEA4806032.1 GBS Bsp-like repeat-containing protein [Acetobacterium wieringae]
MTQIKNLRKQIALGVVMVLALLTFFSYFSLSVEAASTTIVVNPGHQSGTDTGAVNKTTGIKEVDLNNALAIKIVTTLRNSGYNAILSHQIPGNPGLPTMLATTTNNSTTVCSAANSLGADLFLSVHHNSGAATASGYEFYWSSYHPSVDNNGIYQKAGLWSDGSLADLDATPPTIALKSKELANLMNSNFSKNLTYVPSRNKIVERDDAYTRKTSMPSVLIEAGFVSNNVESQKLADGTNQQKMADQVLASVSEIFGAATAPMTASGFTTTVSGDKITATVKGVSAPNGLQVIYIPTWSDDCGQDDLKWYTATKQSDGSYSVTIDVKDHGYTSGDYKLHCYGVDSYGKYTLLGNTTVNVTASVQEKMKATSVTSSVSGNTITATVEGVTTPNGLALMAIPVWSETGGQDDIRWYTATKQTDGSYKVTIDIKDHNYDGGEYNIHAYGKDDQGVLTFLGATTATVKVESMTAVSVTGSVSGSKITAVVKGITAPNGITEMAIPIWSENGGQDDLKWYLATKQSDGSYKITIDIKDHNYDAGVYHIHAYGKDNNNKLTFVGATKVNMIVEPMTATSVTASVSGNKITTIISGINAPSGIKSMLVPTWSEAGGQDDLKWYTAESTGNGTYSVTIDIKDHNYSSGAYIIHVYGKDNADKVTFLGNASANITSIPMSATAVKAIVTENIITVNVSGITAPNGINKILLPTWSDVNGQDDIRWYTATKQSDGSYQLAIDAKNHNGDSGTYSIHAYGEESDGRIVFLGNASASVRYVETPIMGASTVTAAQLVAYYKGTGSVYPKLYNDLGVNLERFAELYVQECNAEGVRAEVAFAQAMLETGNLQFGGDVKVSQFNFAGLGATGGVPGFDFAAVYGSSSTGLQTGIRGHVQHLKCYASSAALNQTKVDPRWNDSLRLRAVSVEELAGTWAADTTYAGKVKAIMKKF